MPQTLPPTNALRKTRTPRVPSTFHLSNGVGATIPYTFKQKLKQALSDPQHPRYNHGSISGAICSSLIEYHKKAKKIKVPDAYRPAARYQDNSSISGALKDKQLRTQYEAIAYGYGITMSELILRCLTAYMEDAPTTQKTCSPHTS